MGKNHEIVIENLHDTKDYSSYEEEFLEEEMDEEESFEKFFQRTHYQVRYNDDEEIIGKCMVCKLSINKSQSRMKCPECLNIAHQLHLLEWIKIKGTCPNCKAKPHEWIKIKGSNLNGRAESHQTPKKPRIGAKPDIYLKRDQSIIDTLGRGSYSERNSKKIENLHSRKILRKIGGTVIIIGGIFLIASVINYYSYHPSVFTSDQIEFMGISVMIGIFGQIFGTRLLKDRDNAGVLASFFGILLVGIIGLILLFYFITKTQIFLFMNIFWWLGSFLFIFGGIISILKNEEGRSGLFFFTQITIIPSFLTVLIIVFIISLII